MTDDTIHTCSYYCERPECVRRQRDELRDRMEAALAQQPAAGDGCHCGTCTCNPNMTPAVRFDLSPAQTEGAIREHLIRLGWTPPDEHAQSQPAEGEEIMVNTPYDVFILPQQPSGLSSGPRFVVHVPGPEQPAAVDEMARRRDVRLWMRHNAGSYSTATELAEAAAEVFNLPDGGLDNETHWVWDEAVEAINDAQREELS